MIKAMYDLKNKGLTELEKFIKEKKIKKVAKVAKVAKRIGLFAFSFILSCFIGNIFFSDFIKENGFWGYLIVYVGLLLVFFALAVIFEIFRTLFLLD